jgi:quinohemoprotein ethanol dehydrogenase
MKIPRIVRWTPYGIALIGAAWMAVAQQPKRVDNTALKNAGKTGEEWLTYGGDYGEKHFSPLKQIDTTNVKRLGLAWNWETESPSGANVETTPLMSNGVLYGSLGWNVLFAVDARTGKSKWRWDPEIPREHIASLCCGPVNRGVAIYNGKIYEGLLDGTVVALDQETGKPVWRTRVTNDMDLILTSAVRVVKGKVIVGSSGAEQAVRGFFLALDADTGKEVWRFWTVPGDPSKGFEHPELKEAAKTWTGEWWKTGGGGGTVWDAMAYDPDADLLYIGTGNGGPWNANIRSPQGGDNLFLSSIIAVKPDTGKMSWYFQTTPGDSWDFTATQPLILADLTINGRNRRVIMQAPKNGFFYVLDRLTGEFISGEKFVKRMTWATGLDKKGRPIEAKGARYTTQAVMTYPGNGGAHNWQPMSFSPITKLVYLPGNEAGSTYTPDQNYKFAPGYWNTGAGVGRRPADAPFVAPPKPEGPTPQPEGAENQPDVRGGFLVAWDPVTQKERWRLTMGVGGPTLATAGNLVFQGGKAYNAETGEKLWEIDLGGSTVTPISYMLDGKQYISLIARAQTNARLFTFVLDGNAEMPPAPPPAAGRGGRGGRGGGQGKGGPGGPPPAAAQGKQ